MARGSSPIHFFVVPAPFGIELFQRRLVAPGFFANEDTCWILACAGVTTAGGGALIRCA
jgi:hypothetical protein